MEEEQINNILNKLEGSSVVASAVNTTNDFNSNDRFFFCDAKTQSELNELIGENKPKLVVLVGFAGYGKSTFVGSLYQQLISNHSYNNYCFVDSDTYVGFERRVFLRRINNSNVSDTKRNVLGENDVLNIKLRSNKGEMQHVIISDKAGETYSRYISSDNDVSNDMVINNADIILFFIDAELLCGSLANYNLISEKYKNILKRFIALGKLKETASYILVFTKIDKLNGEDYKMKLTTRRDNLSIVFKDIIGSGPDDIYEVNSKKIEDVRLNELFCKVLDPNRSSIYSREIDWVKNDIETLI